MELNSTSSNNTMDSLEKLRAENVLLLEENKKLSDTVDWMHETIWRLVRTLRPKS